jgi:hypothetical protein
MVGVAVAVAADVGVLVGVALIVGLLVGVSVEEGRTGVTVAVGGAAGGLSVARARPQAAKIQVSAMAKRMR